MTSRPLPLLLLLLGAALPASAADSIEELGREGEVKTLVERLRREREAQLDQARVFPLGARARRSVAPQNVESQTVRFGGSSASIVNERALESAPSEIVPDTWTWSGESERALEENAAPNVRAAHSWRMGLDVPVSHFWGRATLSAGLEHRRAGASRDADAAAGANEAARRISLRQELKRGALSGAALVAFSNSEARRDSRPTPGERERNGSLEGSANLRLQVRPALALTGSHQSRVERSASLQPLEGDEEETSAASSTSAASEALEELRLRESERWDVERQASRRSTSQLGLEWKWSKSLSLSAQASATRTGEEKPEDGGVWTPQWERGESQAGLALQRRTGGGSWGLRWTDARFQKDAPGDESSNPLEDAQRTGVSLQAERKILPWLSMRGSWRLAGESNFLASRFSDNATREAEARLLTGLGRLAVRYSDWNSQSGTSGSGGALNSSGRREYGVRYEAGSDEGLGLALEYGVREEREGNASSNWRLGLTYR